MHNTCLHVVILLLGIVLLGNCNKAHRLEMEDNPLEMEDNPEEILEIKLNNPQAELTPNQSISLVGHCAQLGEQNAENATDKEVTMVVGNTGAGKSTAVNAVLGCKMQEEVNAFDEPMITVAPDSDIAEVMPIGHGGISKTFLTQIVQNPHHNNNAFCDCPGFLDNRGAEINIANAINTKRVLQQAGGVKIILLTSYDTFSANRGTCIRTMETMTDVWWL